MNESTQGEPEEDQDTSSWKNGDGWFGLFPGKSTVSDVERTLGAPQSADRLANALALDYWDGLLRFSFIDEIAFGHDRRLSCIWIAGRALAKSGLPSTWSDVRRMFPGLQPIEFDKASRLCIYEAIGVRITCDESAAESRIKALEFFAN